jgi:hypothetical protein
MPKHQLESFGGTLNAAIYSGQVAPVLNGATATNPAAFATGSDVCLWSGPGRLMKVVPHQTQYALSGVQLNLYDSNTPVSGGPLSASGQALIGALNAGVVGNIFSGGLVLAGVPINFDMPFKNGLSLNSRSGQVGYTFSWTPEG